MTNAFAGRASLVVFSFTLFLSAALMFALQPMVGKMLLPLVGGTPAGWIVTMAFFQAMLLAGYFLAHFLSRFPPRLHGILYVACLGAGCFFLPVGLAGTEVSDHAGPIDIFVLLSATVAIPFIAVSATSSTIQRLFMTTGHVHAEDPYFLYAASNLGSFTGLFLYPLAFEPAWGLAAQAQNWFYGFAALLALGVVCLTMGGAKASAHKEKEGEPVTNAQRLNWIVLAFMPSALLSAVTLHITTDVFSAPLIWVMPLAIYLLTFVVAFSRKQFFSMSDVARIHRLLVPVAVALVCVYNFNIRISVYTMFIHMVAFGAAALACHMLLAQSRPKGGGRQLTEFYLMMAIGGALGGALNAFVFPLLLDRLIEYPVLMALSVCLHPQFREKTALVPKMFMAMAGFSLFMYLVFVSNAKSVLYATSLGQVNATMILADFILFTIALMLGTSLRAACGGALVILFLYEAVVPSDIVSTTRNFYGVVRVFDRQQDINGEEQTVRFMYHGTTTHGLQVRSPALEKTPTAYFWGGGPVGDIFALYNPKDVAVLGLGAGTLNCYTAPGRSFTFLEIDPAVRRVAESAFTFLSACKGDAPPEIVIGDGRLELARMKDRKFDLIFLDAFSSDTIPIHLLTLEAVKSYADRLSDGGILMFNLSNRYFMLASPLRKIAEELGMKSRIALDVTPRDVTYAADSLWMALAPQNVSLSPLEDFGWAEFPLLDEAQLWTDDYSNLLKTMTTVSAALKAQTLKMKKMKEQEP